MSTMKLEKGELHPYFDTVSRTLLRGKRTRIEVTAIPLGDQVEVEWLLLILVVLLLTERRGRPFAGRTFWLYVLLYGISRFIIELYRGDDRGVILGVSTSQFVSLIAVPVAIAMLVRLRSRAAA